MNQDIIRNINRELLSFIDKSPNAYYAVKNIMALLDEQGYQRLYEGEAWKLTVGAGYYVTRDDSSIIAFRIPENHQSALRADGADFNGAAFDGSMGFNYSGFQIMASHSDSPAFKVKPNAEIVVENSYCRLNTEKYGGMILSTWLDRPLSVAGRIVVRTKDGVETRLVNIDRDLLVIPSLAIHMDRKINEGYAWNAQKDMLPLFAQVNLKDFRALCSVDESEGFLDRGLTGAREMNERWSDAEEVDSCVEGENFSEEDKNMGSEEVGSCVKEGKFSEEDKKACSEEADFCVEDKDPERELLLRIIASEAGVSPEDILDTDLFLYNRNKGTCYGAGNEFIASGRLDDLQCAFASVKGFLMAGEGDLLQTKTLSTGERDLLQTKVSSTNAYESADGCQIDSADDLHVNDTRQIENTENIHSRASIASSVAVCCVFNNEEVGSSTKQGAASSFLESVLSRINHAFGKSEEESRQIYANSFFVSADNAHAVHPNHTDKADPTNRPVLNKGIVVKYNANQKYTTDAVSGGIFRRICEMAGVPVQTYVNRSDLAGGSTLGNIATTRVSMNAVDIGLPQLAMHSAYETAGALDTAYLVEAARLLFSVSIRGIGDGKYIIGNFK